MRKYRGAAASAVSPARIQLQRRRIDAIAQAGRLRPIRKHVAEMCVTARAQYLDAAHAVRAVLARNHCFIRGRIEEARPAGAGLELGVGIEQRQIAADAMKHAISEVGRASGRERGWQYV